MSTALDMSLDDLIKTNKRPSRGSAGGAGGGSRGGRARGSGPGPSRRFPNRAANRANPYSAAKPSWAANNKLFMDQMKSGGRASSGMDTGTKLYISNLDYGVSNEDIKELFSELGDLKKYSINYDRSGRSKGTAEVVFSRRADALLAVKKYNNVQLDGKPMKIEIVGMVPPVIVSAPPSAMPRNSNVVRSEQGRGGTAGQSRGGGGSRGRGFGRGRGRGRGRSGPISAEALDADLDKYHTEAMQTN